MATPHQRPEITGLLMIIFLVHLILSAWGMQSIFNAPTSYLYTNTIFLLSLFYAINSSCSLEAIAMSLLINFTLLNLEIVTFTLYWPRVPWQGHYLGFAITNSSLRPFTCFLLYRLFADLDENGIGIGGFLYNALGYTLTISTSICDVRFPTGRIGGLGTVIRGSGTNANATSAVSRPGTDRYRYEDIDQGIRGFANEPAPPYSSSQEEISFTGAATNVSRGNQGNATAAEDRSFLF